MKASTKMVNIMAKVRKKWFSYDLLTLTLLDDSKGEWFGNKGSRYEGEYKDGKRHGQGKQKVIYFMIY